MGCAQQHNKILSTNPSRFRVQQFLPGSVCLAPAAYLATPGRAQSFSSNCVPWQHLKHRWQPFSYQLGSWCQFPDKINSRGSKPCHPQVITLWWPNMACWKIIHLDLSENRVYSQWNSHLIGIMISKTIGFRATLFSDTPIYRWCLKCPQGISQAAMCLIAGSDCSIEGDDVQLKLLWCERFVSWKHNKMQIVVGESQTDNTYVNIC